MKVPDPGGPVLLAEWTVPKRAVRSLETVPPYV
jgi:hypothetical protein